MKINNNTRYCKQATHTRLCNAGTEEPKNKLIERPQTWMLQETNQHVLANSLNWTHISIITATEIIVHLSNSGQATNWDDSLNKIDKNVQSMIRHEVSDVQDVINLANGSKQIHLFLKEWNKYLCTWVLTMEHEANLTMWDKTKRLTHDTYTTCLSTKMTAKITERFYGHV